MNDQKGMIVALGLVLFLLLVLVVVSLWLSLSMMSECVTHDEVVSIVDSTLIQIYD